MWLVIIAALLMSALPIIDAILADWPKVWRDAWFRVSLIRFQGQWIFDWRWYWYEHHFCYTRMWWPRGIVWSATSSK